MSKLDPTYRRPAFQVCNDGDPARHANATWKVNLHVPSKSQSQRRIILVACRVFRRANRLGCHLVGNVLKLTSETRIASVWLVVNLNSKIDCTKYLLCKEPGAVLRWNKHTTSCSCRSSRHVSEDRVMCDFQATTMRASSRRSQERWEVVETELTRAWR